MDYAQLDDKELAALAARGRELAFRELLSRYERPIFSLVYRMVRDRTLAEDLAQESFVRAFNAIRSYKPRYKFSSWIFKIANNHTIDHLRKRRLETVSIDGSPHALTADEEAQTRLVVESTGEPPDRYVESRELGGRSRKPFRSYARNTERPSSSGMWKAIRTKRLRRSWTFLWER